MKIIIIDNYDSFTFNLYQMLAAASQQHPAAHASSKDQAVPQHSDHTTKPPAPRNLEAKKLEPNYSDPCSHEVKVFRNDQIDLEGIKNLNPDRIVLSPGPGHPAVDTDFGVCKEIIIHAQALACPILGICLGHQGIVQHLGGKVIGAPQIVHGKSSEIKITTQSPIFHGLPNQFPAMRYHSLIAAEESFPEDLCVIAREVKHNLIMAVQHTKYPLYGLQFHPESIGTPVGTQILRNFIEKC
jgi:anthranilate synthase component 2